MRYHTPTAQQITWSEQTIFTDALEQVKAMYKRLHKDEAEACKAAPRVNRAGADCGRMMVPPSNDPPSTSAGVRPIDAEEQESDHLIKEREEVKEQQRLLSQEKETFRQRGHELTAQRRVPIKSARRWSVQMTRSLQRQQRKLAANLMQRELLRRCSMRRKLKSSNAQS